MGLQEVGWVGGWVYGAVVDHIPVWGDCSKGGWVGGWEWVEGDDRDVIFTSRPASNASVWCILSFKLSSIYDVIKTFFIPLYSFINLTCICS